MLFNGQCGHCNSKCKTGKCKGFTDNDCLECADETAVLQFNCSVCHSKCKAG